MIDMGLRLATAESVPNAGAAPGGLGETSVNLGLDLSGLHNAARGFVDPGAGERLLLAFNVDTAFTCGTFGATLEFQLVSLPINATLLTDGSGGAADGKLIAKTLVAGTVATSIFTIVGHGLPLGTPVHLTTFSGGPAITGVTPDIIYYVVPQTADTFKLASSLANALAGTTIVLGGVNGTVTVNFIPTIHASSGGLQLYNGGTPTNQGPLVSPTGQKTRFQVPLRPLATLTPKQSLALSQTVTQPLGGGPVAGLIAANAQRYFYLRYVPSATITAGAVTCDIVLDAGDALKFYPIGATVP